MMKVSRKPILLYRFVAARGELCGLFSICVRRHCFERRNQTKNNTHTRTHKMSRKTKDKKNIIMVIKDQQQHTHTHNVILSF